VNNVTGYLNTIEALNGTNLPSWKEKVQVILGILEYDSVLREARPVISTAPNAVNSHVHKWDRNNRMANMIIKQSISVAIRGAIPDKHEDGRELTAKEFFDKVEENFKSCSKTYASTLIMKMLTFECNG
jgi:hypothetical protein